MLAIAKPVGRIKMRPEDFNVQEMIKGKAVQPVSETNITGAVGDFTAFTMTKRGIAAEAAYHEVARQLDVLREAVTDHGRKDSWAVTSQMIVVEGKFTPSFKHDRIWLRQIGSAKGQLWHGGHDGNRFTIKVETDTVRPPQATRFLNLFGPQRFGDGRTEVGRHLLEENFDQAVELLRGSLNWPSIERIMDAYGLTADDAILHPEFRFELKFKVDQWVSWLWNQLAPSIGERNLRTWCQDSANLYKKWWNPVEVDAEMHDLIHPFDRPVMVEVRNAHAVRRGGGIEHSFTLRSGSYATVYLQSLYDLTDVSREGYAL